MKKMIALAALAFSSLSTIASAAIVGDCSDCHTMHNSEQGKPVAQIGTEGTISETPIAGLLRMDCVGCHGMDAQGPSIQQLPGGSVVPQVYHGGMELFQTTLAGGNFKFAAENSFRKGHHVIDLFPGGDTTDSTYAKAPGYSHESDGFPLDKFTCAGLNGCHGTRNQLLSEEVVEGQEILSVRVERVGVAAITGAHHNNYHGEKVPYQPNGDTMTISSTSGWKHDGESVANSYRFIRGLRGAINGDSTLPGISSVSTNPWDPTIIKYYGVDGTDQVNGDSGTVSIMSASQIECQECHIGETAPDENSAILVPNQTMSGFCITCHGEFHSTGGTGDGATATWTQVDTDGDGVLDTWEASDVKHVDGDYVDNGISGAFLRHPADYRLPSWGEYAAYEYNITAPVAYNDASEPIVMCLSCHAAHATTYDSMLRFDYSKMIAGDPSRQGEWVGQGCLACHTAKGVAIE